MTVSRFAEKLLAGAFPVTLEITPPRERNLAVLFRRAALLGTRSDAIHVVERVGRMSSLDASLELRAGELEPVWHVLNRGKSRDEIAQSLARAAAGGLGCVLCLRGDHDEPDKSDTPTIREVVARTRAELPAALVGVTFNPYAEPEAGLRNLLAKLRAGADYVQTNVIFDVAALAPLAAALRERAPGTPVVAMVVPVASQDAAARLALRVGSPAPPATGAGAFRDLVRELRASLLADGLAVMTLEVDPEPALGRAVLDALQDGG